MEIDNENDAITMIGEWRGLSLPARKKELRYAIQRLELSCMYYEQKENAQGADRCRRCIIILSDELAALPE